MNYDTIQRLQSEVHADRNWETFEYRSIPQCSIGEATYVGWATVIFSGEKVQFESWGEWEQAKTKAEKDRRELLLLNQHAWNQK